MSKNIDKKAIENTALENAGRRKAVKTIVGGVTALAAYNVLPVKWGTPIIEQVFLPAHAATSGPVTFNLRVSSSNSSSDTCGGNGENVSITGTVLASDGSDVAGAEVNIHYTDNPVLSAYSDRVVTVQTGNTFSWSGFMTPDVGNWSDYPYLVEVTFVDQSTYGTASATTTGSCANFG
jgi:hypothetical protein